MDGRVIREGFGMIMTLVLDRLDVRCLWGHPSGDVEQAPHKFGAQRSDWVKVQTMVKATEVEEKTLSKCVA